METSQVKGLAQQYFEDLRLDGREDNAMNLRAWLWFMCPANLRPEVRAAIERERKDKSQ